MKMLGRKDESEIKHEMAELGDAAERPGPLQNLTRASDFKELRGEFSSAVSDLENRLATMANDDAEFSYVRTLLVTMRRVEGELEAHFKSLTGLYESLDESHHLIHELFPAS